MVHVTKEKKGRRRGVAVQLEEKDGVNGNLWTTLVHSAHCKDVLDLMAA